MVIMIFLQVEEPGWARTGGWGENDEAGYLYDNQQASMFIPALLLVIIQ